MVSTAGDMLFQHLPLSIICYYYVDATPQIFITFNILDCHSTFSFLELNRMVHYYPKFVYSFDF